MSPAISRFSEADDLPVVGSSPGPGPIVVLACIVAFPVGLAATLSGSSYDTWGAFVWAPVLLALAYPLSRWVAKRSGEPQIAGFVFGAAVLKIVLGSFLRYYMVDSLYGRGDSVAYDDEAALLTTAFRSGHFGDLGRVTGTRFIEILDGLVQTVIGQTMVGSFLVFSAFGFLGLCFLFLAFREALPGGDGVLYRRLIFLTPTLWFWPSSVGKEAFLMMAVGAFAYGFTRSFNGHLSGLVVGGLGLWGAIAVRPHVALMLMIGAFVALPAFRKRGVEHDAGRARGMARWVAPALLVVALPFLLGSAEKFFGIEHLTVDSAEEVKAGVSKQTTKGGSEFSIPDPNTPVGMTTAIVTVVVRPFPWEAGGFQVVASLESVVLGLVIAVALWRRRRRWIGTLRERWTRFSLAYVLAFAWAFSAVGNFGILARQRSLVMPFVFVLVASTTRPQEEDDVVDVEVASVRRG